MSRSTAASGTSYFGKYVEETLSKLPGEIRMDAEASIMQVLHRAQRAVGHSKTHPPPRQDQQAPFQFQQQFHQFQQPLWQRNPSQWPLRPVMPQTSVWGSQDHSYVQRQFPTLPITTPLPPTNEPHPRPSGGRATSTTTTTTTTTALPSSLDDSLVSLLGPTPAAACSFNLSSQFNTFDPLTEGDDDPDQPQAQAHPRMTSSDSLWQKSPQRQRSTP